MSYYDAWVIHWKGSLFGCLIAFYLWIAVAIGYGLFALLKSVFRKDHRRNDEAWRSIAKKYPPRIE